MHGFYSFITHPCASKWLMIHKWGLNKGNLLSVSKDIMKREGEAGCFGPILACERLRHNDSHKARMAK